MKRSGRLASSRGLVAASPGAMTPEQQFSRQLAVLRAEAESACQFFYGDLAMHEAALRHPRVHQMFNQTTGWWITVNRALQDSSFMAIGRVFDQTSSHGVDRLLKIMETNPDIFSKAALLQRKGKGVLSRMSPDLVESAYELRIADIRGLRKKVADMRRVYERAYKDVRDRVIAHRELADDDDETRGLFSKTNKAELERLLHFLVGLHDSLLRLFVDGHKPVIRRRRKSIKKDGRLVVPRFGIKAFPQAFVLTVVDALRRAAVASFPNRSASTGVRRPTKARTVNRPR